MHDTGTLIAVGISAFVLGAAAGAALACRLGKWGFQSGYEAHAEDALLADAEEGQYEQR